MNTQHLQYVVEIERMRSISQAAENLFIGQPNLSRILHDMEDTLGFKIFERTSRGVRPTERGTIFLQHAKSILREMDSIEALGPRRPVANRLRICIPRSAAMLDLTSEFIATLPEDQNLDVAIRECHARKALELLERVPAEETPEDDAESETETPETEPDSELAAYRRAALTEQNAAARARRLQAHVSALCDNARSRYQDTGEEISALSADLTTGIERLQDALAELQLIFDQSEEAFEALELPDEDA